MAAAACAGPAGPSLPLGGRSHSVQGQGEGERNGGRAGTPKLCGEAGRGPEGGVAADLTFPASLVSKCPEETPSLPPGHLFAAFGAGAHAWCITKAS